MLCEYYGYFGVFPTGEMIKMAIDDTGDYQESIIWLDETIFGEDGKCELENGGIMREEYFSLPLKEYVIISEEEEEEMAVEEEEEEEFEYTQIN